MLSDMTLCQDNALSPSTFTALGQVCYIGSAVNDLFQFTYINLQEDSTENNQFNIGVQIVSQKEYEKMNPSWLGKVLMIMGLIIIVCRVLKSIQKEGGEKDDFTLLAKDSHDED